MNNIIKGSTDFNRVRDGRNSPDAYFDVDLTNAGDRIVNIAGNSFYIDANPDDGNAVVYFQETDNLRGPTPFYVSPGFIARIPFTQIRIANVSQPGKKIRIVYGVDTDFQPGSVSQVSFAGEVSVNDVVQSTNQHYFRSANTVLAYTVAPIVLPAANTNGIALTAIYSNIQSGVGGTLRHSFVAAPASPASFNSGTNRIFLSFLRGANGSILNFSNAALNRIIPIGWGLYDLDESTSATGSVEVALEYRIM